MKQTAKSIECRILSSNCIEYYSTQHDHSPSQLDIRLNFQQPHTKQLDAILTNSLKPYLVRNVSKTKPQDMTTVTAQTSLYETEQMKFQRMMSRAATTKEQQIKIVISTTLAQLLHENEVGPYIFGPYFKMMKYTVQNSHLIVKMDVADDQFDKVKRDLTECIRKVYCFQHTFSNSQHLKYYKKLITPMDVHHIADDKRIIVYTKKQEIARHTLSIATQIVQINIDLKTIFVNPSLYDIIMKYAVDEIKSQHINVDIRDNMVVVIGQLPRVQQYQTHLYKIYASFKVKIFPWQCNEVVVRLLQSKKKNNSISGEAQGRDNRKLINFTKAHSRMEGSHVEITLVCRNNTQIQELYDSLVGELCSISKQVLFVHAKILDFLEKPSIQKPSITEKERLETELNIQITVSEDTLIIIGCQDSIDKLKTEIQAIKDDNVSNLLMEQTKVDEVESNNVQLIMTQQQYELFNKQPFYNLLSLTYRKEDQFTFDIKCTNVDQAIKIKMQILCYLMSCIPLEQCYGSTLSLTIRNPTTIGYWQIPQKIRNRLRIQDGHTVSKIYMLQDKDNTFKETEKCQLGYCYSPLTLERTLNIIEAGQYEELAHYDPSGKPVWHFTLDLDKQLRNMCTYMVASVKGHPDSQKRIQCSRLSDLMPLWLIRLRPR